jgi:hypothetical protein
VELCRVYTTELLVICQEQQVGADEIIALEHDLRLNACPIGSIKFINKPKRNVPLKKEVQPIGFISISYIRGISENFKLQSTDIILKLFAK